MNVQCRNNGKASGRCFAAFWIFTLLGCIAGKTATYCHFLERFYMVLTFLIPCFGIFFAVLGIIKKESPKIHCIVGFVLNVALIALLCFLSLSYLEAVA